MQEQLQSGIKVEDISVEFRLSVLKPMHAKWLYNYFTSEGKDVRGKSWKRAEISGLFDGTTQLPPEDPFKLTKHTDHSHHVIAEISIC